MLAIYKKELRSYFTSMIGYIFIAFFLVIMGIFFAVNNLMVGSTKFEYALSSVTFIFVLLVPLLTMRLMAEENKQKTDQLLLTSPLTASSIILGKFFAVFTIFISVVAIVSTYPLILMQYGKVALAPTYASILGFTLLGGAYLAIGLFISSLTDSQVVAAVISFVIFLFTVLMQAIAGLFPADNKTAFVFLSALLLILCVITYKMMNNLIVSVSIGLIGEAILTAIYIMNKTLFDGSVVRIFEWFSVVSRFNTFVYGMFDLSSIIYYISIIIVFLFLSTQTIKKKRWS